MLVPTLGQAVRVQVQPLGPGEPSLPQELVQDFLLTGLLWHRYFPYSHWPSQKTPPWLSPGMASGDSLPVASMMSRKFSEA